MRRQGRAAADSRGDENGPHDHCTENGTIKAFRYATGDQVVDGAELVEFEVEP